MTRVRLCKDNTHIMLEGRILVADDYALAVPVHEVDDLIAQLAHLLWVVQTGQKSHMYDMPAGDVPQRLGEEVV